MGAGLCRVKSLASSPTKKFLTTSSQMNKMPAESKTEKQAWSMRLEYLEQDSQKERAFEASEYELTFSYDVQQFSRLSDVVQITLLDDLQVMIDVIGMPTCRYWTFVYEHFTHPTRQATSNSKVRDERGPECWCNPIAIIITTNILVDQQKTLTLIIRGIKQKTMKKKLTIKDCQELRRQVKELLCDDQLEQSMSASQLSCVSIDEQEFLGSCTRLIQRQDQKYADRQIKFNQQIKDQQDANDEIERQDSQKQDKKVSKARQRVKRKIRRPRIPGSQRLEKKERKKEKEKRKDKVSNQVFNAIVDHFN